MIHSTRLTRKNDKTKKHLEKIKIFYQLIKESGTSDKYAINIYPAAEVMCRWTAFLFIRVGTIVRQLQGVPLGYGSAR